MSTSKFPDADSRRVVSQEKPSLGCLVLLNATCVSQYSTVTAFVLRYSIRASSPVDEKESVRVHTPFSKGQLKSPRVRLSSPRSLPKPDCLKPPKGEATSVLL